MGFGSKLKNAVKKAAGKIESVAKKIDPVGAKLHETLAKVPGSHAAVYEGLVMGYKGEVGWSPYGKKTSAGDIMGGGTVKGNDPEAQKYGRVIGTVVGAAVGAGAIAGAAGGEAGGTAAAGAGGSSVPVTTSAAASGTAGTSWLGTAKAVVGLVGTAGSVAKALQSPQQGAAGVSQTGLGTDAYAYGVTGLDGTPIATRANSAYDGGAIVSSNSQSGLMILAAIVIGGFFLLKGK